MQLTVVLTCLISGRKEKSNEATEVAMTSKLSCSLIEMIAMYGARGE